MAPSETMPIDQAENKNGVGQRVWDLLTKPASSITDRADRRQARTLSAFLFVFTLLTGIRVLVGVSSSNYLEEPAPFINMVVLVGLLIISYVLSRTKYNAWGSGLAIISTIMAVYLSVLFRADHTEARMFVTFIWLLPALILGSAFFSWRTTLLIFAITLALILATPFLVPGVEMGDVVSAFSIVFVVSLLIVLVNRFRDQLEADRQAELNSTNQELERSSLLLEQRVADRTRALQLAAEISRILSQITNVTDLLQASVETIRSRFDLYYVQIYLTNDTTRSLTLAAGSGNIGQELTRRGHRLIISSNSINGLATAEKRAVIVADTAKNHLFRSNPLLPRTRSEMAIPLIIGDRVVGTLDMQGDKPNDLLADNLPAFEALAGQLAVAIENARLLSDAAEARAEVESYTRRITREGWSSYLDAIHRPSFIGFSFDGDSLAQLETPLSPTSSSINVAQVPIDVIGETVGAIQIEDDEDRIWTADDLELIQAVSTQVGQQIEMLRSLDEASQYRKEAEHALRRVTHEAWMVYEKSEPLANGYAYDQMAVKALTAVSPSPLSSPETIHRNLSLHGEAVGELTVEKSAHMDEKGADELITAVADHLISHMESLRLTEQTESALGDAQRRERELSVINAVAEASADITVIHDFLEAVHHQLEQVLPMNSFTASTYDATENLIGFEYAYDEKNGMLENPLPIQLEPYHLSYKTIHEATPQIIHFTEAEIEEQKRNRPPNMMSADASLMASLLFVPLISGQEVIGIISAQSYRFNVYTPEHISLLTGVAGYVTTAIQKARLFAQIEARVEELSVINEVAQIVAKETNRLALLKAVLTQIQRIMTIDAYFVALYHAADNSIEYPFVFENNHIFITAPEPLDPKSKMNEVLQTSKPILLNWTQEEINKMKEADEITLLGDTKNIPASLVFVPLLLGQEVLGMLSVQAYEINAYNQADVDLLSGIANHVALSLENTRLLETTQQAANRQQLLREISATINSSIDAESVLQTAAREIGRAIGAETYVYLTGSEQMTKSATNGNNKHHD